MRISEVIETLTKIQEKFGDIAVTGGYLRDNTALTEIIVTDSEGMEVWPEDPNGVAGKHKIDGVFLQ
jgi:hypothetical protein